MSTAPVFDRRPQITGDERQPLDLALGRMLRFVGVGVADDDERLLGVGRHFARSLVVETTLRPNFRKSSVIPASRFDPSANPTWPTRLARLGGRIPFSRSGEGNAIHRRSTRANLAEAAALADAHPRRTS
jgi:hypothetical protein